APTAAGAGAVGAAPAGLGAALRLRHTTTGFQVPLELRVGGAGGESAVSLQRFAPSGTIDFALDFPEVAQAINTAVAAAGGGAGPGEHVANGDFAEWFRLGALPHAGRSVRSPDGGAAHELAVFSADGARAFVVGHRFVEDRAQTGLIEVDVFAAAALRESALAAGVPVALARDGAGRRLALVLTPGSPLGGGAAEGPDTLVLVDAATLRPIGAVGAPPATRSIVAAPDGRGVYLASRRPGEGGTATVLRHVDWADLEAAAGGSPLDWENGPRDVRPGDPVHLTTGPAGQVALLTRTTDDLPVTRLFTYRDRAAVASGDPREAPATAVADTVATAWPPGDHLLLLEPAGVTYLRVRDLIVADEVPLDPGGATSIALDGTGALAAVALDDAVGVLEVATRRFTPARVTVDGDGETAVVVSPAGTHALLTKPYADRAQLVTVGDAQPAEWEVTAGTVRPVSLPATGEVMAVLGQEPPIVRSVPAPAVGGVTTGGSGFATGTAGDRAASRLTPPGGPTAMSQVMPVVGGARYRFAFDGLALVAGASAQVRWTGDGCTVERVDRVPVTVFDVAERASLEAVPHHEAVLVAPVGARSAEVRFFTAESLLLVDKVTLAGSAEAVVGAWEPASVDTTATPLAPAQGPSAGVPAASTAGGPAVVLTNAGAGASAVTARAAVAAGAVWDLTLTAVAAGSPGARAEVTFADEAGAGVGEAVTVPLDVLDLDARAATGTVPAGAVEAVIAVVLPAGAEVTLTALSLTADAPTAVDLYFASAAPGEVRMTDVEITFEAGVPCPAPVPTEGLCPPTPAGAGEDGTACYCQACGQRGPVGKARPVRTGAGRAAVLTACPTCGTDRLRTGGRVSGSAVTVALPRFQVVDRPLTIARADPGVRVAGWAGGPALVTGVRVAAAVTDVEFIGPARAAALAAAGVHDVVALSRADVRLVAGLPGVSDVLAARIVADAAKIVRLRGSRVLLA
ncbi:MAG: helix-hairpin-helix domain-containing protein, partial [Georgenia sp.]